MQKQLQTLLQKEMTRREFLATLGFGVASVLGFSGIIKMLSSKTANGSQRLAGYGSSAYGGGRDQ